MPYVHESRLKRLTKFLFPFHNRTIFFPAILFSTVENFDLNISSIGRDLISSVCLDLSKPFFQEFKLASGLPVVCIGFELTFSALDKDWVNMVCSGLEPGAAGWKTQTNPLSYGLWRHPMLNNC